MTAATDTDFVFNPADDEAVDAEYVLIADPRISIQCAPYAGGYAVNEHGGEGAGFWMRTHGIFPSLLAAKEVARSLAA